MNRLHKRFPGLSSTQLLVILAIGAMLGAYLWPEVSRRFSKPEAQPRLVEPRGDLAADERSTIELFQKASPSIAYITTLTRQVNPWTRNARDIPAGTGSGFVWDAEGHIITNFHVIQDASAANVMLDDRKMYPASLVGASPDHDLAVLKIRASESLLRPVSREHADHGGRNDSPPPDVHPVQQVLSHAVGLRV